MKRIALTLLFLLDLHFAFAQQRDSIPADIVKNRKKIVIGAIVVQQASSFYIEYQWWWKNDSHPFNFKPDGFFNNYSYGVDKIGHFYTSYVSFHGINEIMKWAHFSQKTRLITSTVIPLTWAISIELGDGFSSYGFSWEDLAANSLGIAYGAIQEKFPYMKNFKVKFSYYPSQKYIDQNFKHWSFSEDYRGHTYWLAFDVHNLLPKPAKRYWPPFMNIAFGYGIDTHEGNPVNREFAISLDWNFASIKTRSESVTVFKEIIDYIHFPAPGVSKVQGEKAKFEPILFR